MSTLYSRIERILVVASMIILVAFLIVGLVWSKIVLILESILILLALYWVLARRKRPATH
jgi:hypothetical protein